MSKEDFHFSHRLRVRWSEADSQGVVFYGNHLNYFDVAQTEYMRDLGFPYPDGLTENGTDVHVVKAGIELFGAVNFDDAIDIYTRISRVGRSSLTFSFEIYRDGEDDLLISGESIYVNVDVESRKSAALPDALVEKVKEREGEAVVNR